MSNMPVRNKLQVFPSVYEGTIPDLNIDCKTRRRSSPSEKSSGAWHPQIQPASDHGTHVFIEKMSAYKLHSLNHVIQGSIVKEFMLTFPPDIMPNLKLGASSLENKYCPTKINKV